MSTSFKKNLGNRGELLVEKFLINQGFKIVDRNFSIRGGEIDIIAKKDVCISFIEVKTRTHQYFNTSEVITPSKQKKIILTAKYFIAQHQYSDISYRFDVALVDGSTEKITYIEHAFLESNY